MYSFEMTTVSDFTEEIFYKMQSVESEKIMEYCNTINESATESAKNVTNGMKTMFAKIMANVFEDGEDSVMTMNGDNPFLIDLVVRNIMKYLSMKDLSFCRLVCKLWNDEASVYFRQSQRIIFYPESTQKMSAFTNFVSQSKACTYPNKYCGPPFSTYCFTAQYTTTQFPHYILQQFVSTCGEFVRKLEIFYPDEAHLSPRDFTAFFLTGMPNLESIHIVNLPRSLTQSSLLKNDDDQDHDDNPNLLSAVTHLRIDRTWQMETVWGTNFLHDLLVLMPNLLDYELWTWNSTTEDDHSVPYLISLSAQNVQRLRVLRPGSIGDRLTLTIASMGLHLTKLFLPVLNRAVSADMIEVLLQSQKGTLEEFQLNCSTMRDERLLTFPRMEKLRSLHIMITYPWNNDYTSFTPSVDYHAQFPVLDKLRVELAIYNDGNFINYFFPNKKTTCCGTVVELDISFSGFRNEKFIETVTQIFPNVKKLKLDGYGSRIFSGIFQHMQENLEGLELYLIYGFNVDDQMTGIPKDVILRNKDNNKFFANDEIVAINNNASLCSLKNLRSLSIKQKDYQAKFWPDAQCITDITAYMTLSQMKKLTHLHIESVKFTHECKQSLAHDLENCWLDFT